MAEATGQSGAIGADARRTLKSLALAGALEEPAKLSCSALADRLEVSTQTASRRLRALEEAGLIEREMVGDGQLVRATDAGERVLRREYADYRRIFEGAREIRLRGSVTEGMGEGKHYITLPGYMRQFREKLGYEPDPGTLNVELDEPSTRSRAELDTVDPVRIDGWEGEDRTYGPAFCWPAALEHDRESYGGAHVIAPERTHHGQDKLELIAPDRLRDELGLADDDEVIVRVTE
jgi:riboflavin kinase